MSEFVQTNKITFDVIFTEQLNTEGENPTSSDVTMMNSDDTVEFHNDPTLQQV